MTLLVFRKGALFFNILFGANDVKAVTFQRPEVTD